VSRVVSVTPHAVERDSRTFKQAATIARLGYESVVVEAEPSALDRAELPFSLITVREAVAHGAAGDPDAAAAPMEQPEERRGVSAWIGENLPEPVGRPLRGLIDLAHRLIEPAMELAGNLRWNMRTLRSLPEAQLYILHAYNQFPAVYLKSRRVRSPYIYDAHDSYWEDQPGRDGLYRNRLSRGVFMRMERFCARHAAGVMTVSDGVAGLLEPRFGLRPLVLRNAGDLRLDRAAPSDVRTAAGLDPDDFLLVMTGNAKPGDTIDEALRALRMLPGRVHLALVGSGHERFEAAANERGVGHRIHGIPAVPPNEVASFISTADAAPILYQAWTVNFQHALPNRFFHAIAAGLPLLYPPLAEIVALAERYELGLPIEPTEPESVAGAVQSLLDDPDLTRRLKENVERARDQLSWEREEQVLSDLVAAQLPGAARG
jgi:glycosyltransferase involved in cell wall biosynthesis